MQKTESDILSFVKYLLQGRLRINFKLPEEIEFMFLMAPLELGDDDEFDDDFDDDDLNDEE